MASPSGANNTSDLESRPLLGNNARSHNASGREPSRRHWKLGGFAIILVILGLLAMGVYRLVTGRVGGEPHYGHLKGSCDHVNPISAVEFVERQTNLSQVLVNLRADAYIAEPGSNMKYFTNIRWSLSERPFLLVVQARRDRAGQVLTRTTIVAPAFEASRARQSLLPGLSIPIKTWEESGSAYKVVREVLESPWSGQDDEDALLGKKKEARIYVDPDMRQFVSHGLSTALETSSRKVTIADQAISLLRMQKTEHEVEILRCVSQTTVNVIRAVRRDIKLGIRESEVQILLSKAYREAGLEYEDGGSLVLFGKDAALPHGSGNDTKLEKGMMVLIDSGARLHGYTSDITRTFWIGDQDTNEELNKVWGIVKQAQIAALNTVRPGAPCSSIDKAARSLISDHGYGPSFTHRLGHGLGLDGHEDPYLNAGNTHTELRAGMVFTNEPGIYVEGGFGIRLEDVILVTETGYEILSGDLALSENEP
ncbi:Creatinase/aminopeptidase [Mortierella sp. GBAus27b]|nr:hypothetical protein BGX31_006265 [Mortierella sp. GBA43]KAI8345487.1 Creatinase/aminopeptidase [Mortierella sp. GBAus27b]